MHTRDISPYQHAHLFHYTGEQAEKRTMRVVLLTVAMMFVEIVAGWVFKSMALFADGWHMSTHAAALGISWLAFVLARRYMDDRRFAFGTWKIEVLGGFVSAILLGLVGVTMACISVARLLYPADIQFDQAILVAVIGLVVNVVSIVLLRDRHAGHDHHGADHHTDHHHEAGHHHDHHGHHHGNLNLRAAYIHVVADALTSVLAIVALLGGKFMHWNALDPLMGIVGSILILRWTYTLLQDTGSILLDRETHDDLAAEIRTAIESDGDTQISDLHVWQVGQDRYACILGLVAQTPRPLSYYRDKLREVHKLAHVTVEIELFR